MIYVLSLDTNDFDLYHYNSSNNWNTYASKNISNAWCLILDSKVYYGPIIICQEINYPLYFAFGHYTISGVTKASKGGEVLEEGWYINYMGCIYDYQGNIVE